MAVGAKFGQSEAPGGQPRRIYHEPGEVRPVGEHYRAVPGYIESVKIDCTEIQRGEGLTERGRRGGGRGGRGAETKQLRDVAAGGVARPM